MSRDTIVYFGVIQYEYNNAMCQHTAGIKKLIEGIGYKSVTIGVSSKVSRGQYEKINENTFVVNAPKNIIDRIRECIFSLELKGILKEIGLEKIKTFIMADFRYFPMKNMEKFCKENGILYAVDIMDKFVSGGDFVSKIKKVDCDLRLSYLYPKIERRIYICSYYNELIGTGKHTAVIPGVTWSVERNQLQYNSKITLVFMGRPGKKCEKEKIDWIIRGIYENKLSNKFKVYFAGFDEKEFIKNNPQCLTYLTESILFCGRLKKDECATLLQGADFSLIIRPDTTLSRYGFSTKIGEAFASGIPVLATDTSDNKKYIKNGINGYVCNCTYDDVAALLLKISKLSTKDIRVMKKNCVADNPLDYKRYLSAFKRVIVEL